MLAVCWLVAGCLGFWAGLAPPAAGAPGPGDVRILPAAADATVDAARPRAALGARRKLRVAQRPAARVYVSFRVPEGRVASAQLRLFALDRAPRGFHVHAVGARAWSERTLTYRSAPGVMGAIGASGPVARRSWTSVPVTGAVQAGRELTLVLIARSRRALRLASREARSARLRPQLLVLFEPPTLPVDRPPTCQAARHRVQEDGVLQGRVPCADEEGGLGWKVVREPTLGAVEVRPDGQFTYRPAAERSGADGFAVAAIDGAGQSVTAEVGIEVEEVNDPPAVRDDTAAGEEDTPLSVDVLANDAAGPGPESGQAIVLDAVTSPPAHGAAVIRDGAIVYTPAADRAGMVELGYRACDAAVPRLCANARLRIDIAAVNDPPAARDDTAAGEEDTPLTVDVLANDAPGPADEQDQELRLAGITKPPSYGRAEVTATDAGPRIRYRPPAGYSGPDWFDYEVCDAAPAPGRCSAATVSVLVGTGPPGDVPARPAGCFRPYSADGPWNTPIGASPTYHSATEKHVGALEGELSSDVTQFTFPVYEVNAATTPRSNVTLDGWFSNVEAPDTLINQRGGDASLPLPLGAEPADGDDRQIVLIDSITGDEWGASRLRRDVTTGNWEAWNAYHYNTRWSGVPPRDAKDKPFFLRGAGVPYLAGLVRPCEIARGRIEHALAFAYDSPTPAYVYPATKSDGIGTDPADMPEGARLQLDPSLGRAEIEAWGCTGACLTIARALQEYGMYIIDNSGRPKVMLEYEGTAKWNGVVGAATVSPIPLERFKLLHHPPPADQPPLATADSATVLEDAGPKAIDVLANDADADGGPKSIASRTQPASGSVQISDDGLSVTYEPDPNFCNDPPGTTTDDFRYTLAPGGSSATVKVRVTCVNDAPVANADSAGTDNDTTLNVSAPGVLANDTDPDPGDTKSVKKLNGSTTLTGTSVKGGAVTIDVDGSYSYSPAIEFKSLPPGESGTDSFTYTMADGSGAESTAAVNITITGPAPTAGDDSFATVGNTGLFVGTTPPAGQPGRQISGSVLENDTDPDTPHAALTATPATALATALGGSVTIESDGNFSYVPPTGGSAPDSFTYTVSDGVASDSGTVTITRANEVWYVRNNAAPGGTGRSTDPFDTIAEAEAASGTGDDIYVFDGDGTTAGLTTGFDLETNQRLRGEAVDLKVGGDTLFTGSPANRPTLTQSDADVVALASGATVSGFELDPSGAGGGIAGVGAGVSGSTIRDVRVIDDGADGTQPGLELDGTTATHNISDLTVSNAATGVRLNNAGTVVFAAAGTISITSAGAKGLDAAGTSMGPGSVFDEIVVTGSGSGAVRMASMSGTTTLGDGVDTDLNLTTTSGATPALLLNSAGAISVPAAGTANISATGGPAIDVTGTSGAMLRLDDVDSTNSAGDGINLAGLATGTFSATSGDITGAAGIAFDLEGGSGNITYPGALNDGLGQTARITGRQHPGVVTLSGNIADSADPGGGIVVTGNLAGSTVFSGLTKTLNTGASTAVALSSDSGHAITFSRGGLDIDTTTGAGIAATETALLAVTGSGNTISSGTGTALTLTKNTSIGTAGLTFESISANGGANGIVLDNTGSSGGLMVTGTGVPDSGGIIENQTGPAIRASNTTNLSLSSMRVQGAQDDGIQVLQGGSAAMTVSVTRSTFSNNSGDHFEGVTSASTTGVLDITFRDNKLATTADALGGGIAINSASGAQVSANVQGNDIQGAVGSAIAYKLAAPSSGFLKGTISGNTIGQPGVPGSGSLQGDGISVTGNGNGAVTVAVLSNLIRQWSNRFGIRIAQGSGAGTTNVTVQSNTISSPGLSAANGIHAEAGAIAGDAGTLCADIGGTGVAANSATGSGASLSTDLHVQHNFGTTVQLPGYGGSATDTDAVSSYLSARNGGASGSAIVNTTAPFGGQYENAVTVPSCPAP